MTTAWRDQPRAPLLLAPLVAHGLVDATRAVAAALAIPDALGREVRSQVAASLVRVVDGELRKRLLEHVAARWWSTGGEAIASAALDSNLLVQSSASDLMLVATFSSGGRSVIKGVYDQPHECAAPTMAGLPRRGGRHHHHHQHRRPGGSLITAHLDRDRAR